MNFPLAVLLLPIHFTAPADTLGVDAAGRVLMSLHPVHEYVFHRLDSRGILTSPRGFADSLGRAALVPHAPGTRETAWLAPDAEGEPMTIYVLSLDASGNLSSPSNGLVLGKQSAPVPLATRNDTMTTLDVPLVCQARERCGQAALSMVLGYYGAAPAAMREVDAAFDPILRGSLITDLAAAARRAGYEATIATLTTDSLIALLNDGVPPIVLYQNGTGPITVRHFGVVTGWDAARASFTLHDGTAKPRVMRRDDLVKRWEPAGSQALIVRRAQP